MTDGAAGFRDVADGLGLLLSTQSFAARALIGSLCAALLAATAVRLGWVQSTRVRRGLVMAPIGTAAAAAVASAGDTFLPPLLVATSGAGEPFEVFGEEFAVLQLEWLLVAYVAVASFLLLRRSVGLLACRALVRRAVTCDDPAVVAIVRRLSTKLGIGAPQLLLIDRCPGGAFTAGLRRPMVGVDPSLVEDLDDRELEGLLAHELAHIARRDVPINLLVGVIRDLTFFIPPLHVAGRWLRREQEHAADDLASDATGRPAALASSILKVWEARGRRGTPMVAAMACATIVPAPVGVPSRILRDNALRGGAKLIAARVLRLIEGEARPSAVRERVEMALLLVVLAALTGVTVVLPAQLADSSLLLGQWSRPVASPVQSPAMATFQALAPAAPAPTTALTIAPSSGTAAEQACRECLLPESAADWRRGTIPAGPARAEGLYEGTGYVWEDGSPALAAPPRAEPLWGVDSPTGRVGVFVVR